MELSLETRLAAVRERIANAAARAGRSLDDITLIGVSKTVGRSEVDRAYDLGLRDFGENRVQDCLSKFATPLPPDARLHLIGQLQTNKVKQALTVSSIIHSVDRYALIEELEKRAAQTDRVIDVLLQVNISGEEQKAGMQPDEAAELVDAAALRPHLRPRGLMTMAPLAAEAEAARPTFRRLRELRDRIEQQAGISLPWLSMGMTNDFEVAIEEGATHVRVGRAIFVG